MKVSIVVAMDRRRAIGTNGDLPWHLPADLKHFRRITMGKPIVMGRKTHESIGRALPGRQNIVISGSPGFNPNGCVVVDALAKAFRHVRDADEVMIIGGAALYREALPHADRMYLTEIRAEVGGDVYFPGYSADEWREIDRTDRPADAENRYPLSFVVLERVRCASSSG